jgi:hypothetical protein
MKERGNPIMSVTKGQKSENEWSSDDDTDPQYRHRVVDHDQDDEGLEFETPIKKDEISKTTKPKSSKRQQRFSAIKARPLIQSQSQSLLSCDKEGNIKHHKAHLGPVLEDAFRRNSSSGKFRLSVQTWEKDHTI